MCEPKMRLSLKETRVEYEKAKKALRKARRKHQFSMKLEEAVEYWRMKVLMAWQRE